MKQSLKELLQTEFPEWHKQPLRLSKSEIEYPDQVLEEFFEQYSLPNIRACLSEWLNDVMNPQENGKHYHIKTHRRVERLVEATWLTFSRDRGKKTKNDLPLAPSTMVKNDPIQKLKNARLDLLEPFQFFFDFYPLPNARNIILSACKAAESNYVWADRSPADLLHYFDMLKNLINGVYDLVGAKKIKPIIQGSKISPADIGNQDTFSGAHDGLSVWDYFPRWLTEEEVADPYFTLFKFSCIHRKHELKETMKLMLEFALSKNNIVGSGNSFQLLQNSELLLKLMEASHLINLRINSLG